MKRREILVFFISLFFATACKKANQTPLNETNIVYFDAEKYITECIQLYQQKTGNVRKEMAYDGKKDEIIVPVDSIHWENELEMFRNLNINKNALKGLYKVDSSKVEEMLVITYSLLPEFEDKSSVKELIVGMQDGECKYLLSKYLIQNLLFETSYHLSFFLDKYYEIRGEKKIRITGEKTTFSVEGFFAS